MPTKPRKAGVAPGESATYATSDDLVREVGRSLIAERALSGEDLSGFGESRSALDPMPESTPLSRHLDRLYAQEQDRAQADTEAVRAQATRARRGAFSASTTSPAPTGEQTGRMLRETAPAQGLAGYTDPEEFAKAKARDFVAKFPDATDAELEQFREWGERTKALNKARESGRANADLTGYENLPFGWKAAAVATSAIMAGADALTAGAASAAIDAGLVEGSEGRKTTEAVADVRAGAKKAAPGLSAGLDAAAEVAGTLASPVMKAGGALAGVAGAGRVAQGAAGFATHSAARQGMREATGLDAEAEGTPFQRILLSGADGALKGAAIAKVTPWLTKAGEAAAGRLIPGLGKAATDLRVRFAAAVEQAGQNAVMELIPSVDASGVRMSDGEGLGVQILVGALFGAGTKQRFSDVFRRELGKAGLTPEQADALAPALAEALDATKDTPPDPALMAEVEKATAVPPSADPAAATAVLKDAVDKGLVKPEEIASPERVAEYRQSEYEARRDGATPEQAAAFATARVEAMPPETRPDGTVAAPTMPTREALDAGLIEGPARPIVEKIVAEGGDTVSSGVGADGRPFAVGVDAKGETIVERGEIAPRAEAPAPEARPVSDAPKPTPPPGVVVPKGYEYVGKNKRGKDVFKQVREDGSDRYVVRGVGNRLSPPHPDDIAEARANARAAMPPEARTEAALAEIHKPGPDDSGGTTLSAGVDPIKAGGALSRGWRKITDASDRMIRAGFDAVVRKVREGPIGRAADRVFGLDPETGDPRTIAAAVAKKAGIWANSRFLSREYAAARSEQGGIRGRSQFEATRRSRPLIEVRGGEQRTPEDVKSQYDYLNGDLARDEAVKRLGDESVKALDKAAAATTAGTKSLVALGRLGEDALKKYPGEGGAAYLRRVYELIERQAEELGVSGEPSRTKNKKIHRRQDLTEMQRTFLGEIRDVAVLVDHTLRYQGALIATARFQQRLADSVALDRPADGYHNVPLPNDPRFGPLAGKFLPVKDYTDIHREGTPESWGYRIARAFNRYFRAAHTAYNPGTWVRNAAWNTVASHVSNLDAFNPADSRFFWRAQKVMRADGDTAAADLRSALIEARILGSDFLASDVRAAQDRVAEYMTKDVTHGEALLGLAKNAATAPMAFYSAQDNFFKVALYLKATAPEAQGGMGMDHALAVHYVRDLSGLPDFETGLTSRVPRNKTFIGEIAANPFLRGQMGTMEAAGRMLVHHPTRVLALGAAFYGMTKAAQSALGMTDEDVAAMNDVLPEWRDVTLTTPLLPVRSADGKLVTIDITSIVPGAREWKTILSVAQGTSDPLEGANIRQIPFGPLVQLAAALTFNRDPMTMKEIDTSKSRGAAASDAEGKRNRARFIGKILLPDFMPFGGRSWGKIADAFKDTPLDRAGTIDREPLYAVLQAFGANVRKVDVNDAVTRFVTQHQDRLAAKKSGLMSVLSDRSKTQEEKARALVEYESDVGTIAADFARVAGESIPRLRAAGLIGAAQK